jgi:putative DNA primase/helicase
MAKGEDTTKGAAGTAKNGANPPPEQGGNGAGNRGGLLDECTIEPALPPEEPAEPSPDQIDEIIARLARLPLIRYADQRRSTAQLLGWPVNLLDRIVTIERQKYEEPEGAQGRPIVLIEPEPWPEPVDGAAFLDELTTAIRDYVVIDEVWAHSVALWVLFCHAFGLAEFSPKLHITSPTKRSGKTRLLRVLAYLATRSLPLSNISPPALYRVIEKYRPTLFIDEADTFVLGNDELRGLLNGGYDLDCANTIRCSEDEHREPRLYSLWCPQVIAGIGKLAETTTDRSFVIQLKRKLRSETVKPLRRSNTEPLRILARKAARWVKDNLDRIAAITNPSMPPEIDDRFADAWSLPMAIAEAAGGHWPQRAKEAALFLGGARGAEEDNRGVLLLSDLRELFDPAPGRDNPDARPSEVLFSSEIVTKLNQREDRPWAARGRDGITANQVARLLKPFGIPMNRTVRRGAEHHKGFRREWFDDAFQRYLPDR